MIIHIINGPNLNLLGKRQPEIYGARTFEEYLVELRAYFPGHTVEYFQSNHEGAIIDTLHEVGFEQVGIVLNPGGYTHTSVALADAVAAIEAPVVDVHISNIHAREAFRRHSYVSPNCVGHFIGLGLDGYKMAIEFLLER